VVLVRIAEQLTCIHGVVVKVIAQDFSRPNVAAEVYHEITRASIHIDVLVNNAGFGSFGAGARLRSRSTPARARSAPPACAGC
jgi:hypothetical protein